jgi:hypothetical protein
MQCSAIQIRMDTLRSVALCIVRRRGNGCSEAPAFLPPAEPARRPSAGSILLLYSLDCPPRSLAEPFSAYRLSGLLYITSHPQSLHIPSSLPQHLHPVPPPSMRSPVWTACAAFVFATHALAAPHSPRTPAGVHVPLIRRAPAAKSWEDQLEWARAQKSNTQAKYGAPTQNRKRSSGTNLCVPTVSSRPLRMLTTFTRRMVNQDQDSSFYGTIAVGTPATTFNVILDTGPYSSLSSGIPY